MSIHHRRHEILTLLLATLLMSQPGCQPPKHPANQVGDRQITRGTADLPSPGHARAGRILTHTAVWSSDGESIVYDTRSDPAGNVFDGNSIAMVNVHSGQVREIFRAKNGAHCGVATFHPRKNQIVFILGPDHPTPDWQYGPFHRQGALVAIKSRTGVSSATNLDARDLTPPFTPGALRGGTHLHVWDAAGDWISFTYEDHLLAQLDPTTPGHDVNQRNVGVSAPLHRVTVDRDHPRNQDGDYFSVLVTRTRARPKPGSDEIRKAFEEGWVGTNGYARPNGSRQHRAIAFQGDIVSARHEPLVEVFIVDLPEDLTIPGEGPLAGTETRMPSPPKGCIQRRLTFTQDRKFPGIQGPRHWVHSSPDGSRIAFLMKDDAGIVQLWTISPNGGKVEPLTRNPWSISSAFTWSPDGTLVAHVMDNSVCVTDVASRTTRRITARSEDADAPRPEACVFSPDGSKVAYVRRVEESGRRENQIFVVDVER